jgi:hypothetical protein
VCRGSCWYFCDEQPTETMWEKSGNDYGQTSEPWRARILKNLKILSTKWWRWGYFKVLNDNHDHLFVSLPQCHGPMVVFFAFLIYLNSLMLFTSLNYCWSDMSFAFLGLY